MPGQKRKGEFWFLENLHVPRGKAILLFTKLNYWFEPYLRKERYTVTAHYENKQLMPGQKRNGEFCFLETLHDPRGKAKGNIEIEGNKTHCFLQGQSLSVLLYLPTHKYTKNCEEIICLMPAGSQICCSFKIRSTTWSHASRKFKLLFP